jgi:hypothetical protein
MEHEIHLREGMIFAPGAFMPTTVPLVVYDSEGHKKQIGMAFVKGDGQIEMKITDEFILDMLLTTNGHFSISELKMDNGEEVAEVVFPPATKKEQ